MGKSAVMKIGHKSTLIKDGEKKQLEERNVYKYLGILIGNNRIFGYHQDKLARQCIWKVIAVKNRARELPDIVEAAIRLWTGIVNR